MSNEVVTLKSSLPSLQMTETQLITVLENSLYPGAQSASIALVINYCRAAGLDPMMKPVHIVPMWDGKAKRMRDVIMPGVGLYRTQAARSGQYAGLTEPEYGPDVTEKVGGVEITYPVWCRVTAKRAMENGVIAEFSAVERWKENYAVKGGQEKSVAPNAMWLKRPYGQLAKCASAQALRIAFPELTGAQPTADEMEGKVVEEAGEIIDGATGEIVQHVKELPIYTETQLAANCKVWQTAIDAGKQTPQKIIAMISTKYRLSPEHAETIRQMGLKVVDAEIDPFVAEMNAAESLGEQA